MANPSQNRLQEETRPGTDEDIHARIVNRLKACYDEVLSQPVPERFNNLLTQLDKQSASPR